MHSIEKNNMKKIILLGIVAFLIIAQFFRIDKTNPPIVAENDILNIANAPEHIGAMMKAACYDCHSNETKYPWYMDIAPISWWTKGHVNNARGSLNYSEWVNYSAEAKKHKLEDSALKVRKKWMPITTYLLMHPEARISEEDREELATWFESQI